MFEEIWQRLTVGRSQQQQDLDASLLPDDRVGTELYMKFHDCLQENKYHVFIATGLVTVPWSFYRKSIGPFVVGTILSVLPDIVYANWRCDDKYRLFQQHCQQVQSAMQAGEQHRQQQLQHTGASAAKR